jgi:uncharacterized protein (DUF2141 family)
MIEQTKSRCRRSWGGFRPAAFSLGAAALASALALGSALASEGGGARAAKGTPAEVSLTVKVQGLENDKGRVAVALFASADAFPDQKRALAGQVTKITRGRASVTFARLRPGLYAVAVLHDENQNSKMDFNFLGMPLEGYGFSNDASAPFGPPSFEAAAFKLTPRNSFVPVNMRYFF